MYNNNSLRERQQVENVRELQEMAITRADDIRHLKYRIDDLAMAVTHIVKRVSLQPLTVKESEDFIRTMERIQSSLKREQNEKP